ncbi:hypothetical protein L1987_79426 [Smallanthus sonchifolius]|uniref:Uncharacterized protein n=1 Tax=Smallanthus sonchifolius TaxID=185202 RepID=A0ACB8ZEG2_9ASTR|nr:hypothetical protein L1987_79426 [Smallanthus sonchifolius]
MEEVKFPFRFMVLLYLFTAARLSFSLSSKEKVEESPDGDIIDCVHISHQPAFDHPLLKNHTIKMRPNYHPNWINLDGIKVSSMVNASKDGASSSSLTQLWHSYGKCPKGTIPIRRTKKEEVLNSVKIYRKKKFSKHQHAYVYTHGEFYGAKATLNVWNPKIQKSNEFSQAQMWIIGGSFDSNLNTIEAGWHVYPEMYGDNNTRFFIYWTSDGYVKTGCYNLKCSGFIQVNNQIVIGGSFSRISQFYGTQYQFTIIIWKELQSGDWWMRFGNGEVLGYWPSSLFSYLSESASMIQWGGEVVNLGSYGHHTTTQMGSGQFRKQGLTKASYIRDIETMDESNILGTPKDLNIIVDQNSCYDISSNFDTNVDVFFYFGGPGRNKNCP